MTDVFLDALLDTLKILPFLLLTYIAIEVIEKKALKKLNNGQILSGKLAPVTGACIGVIPQCGFSVMATDLYSKRLINLGTLIAIYISTSDEALPILLGAGEFKKLLPLLALKIVLSIAAGYIVNAFYKPATQAKPEVETTADVVDAPIGCCGHKLDSATNGVKTYFLHPLLHSAKISVFIFAINFALGILIYYLGTDKLAEFAAQGKYAQPFVSALLGLIPNCAISVLLTQLYVIDGISLGAAFSGLAVNAGVAFAVLYKHNRPVKQNVFITLGLYAYCSIAGLIILLIEQLT